MVERVPDEPSDKVDGRHERVRAGKIEAYKALLGLFADGRVSPPQAELAAKAGVSERTLFRYFNSYEEVIAGTIGYVYPAIEKFFTASPPDGDLQYRLSELAKQRVRFARENGTMARSVEALVPTSESARVAKYVRDIFFAEQVIQWIGEDRSRIDDAELVIVTNLFSFLSVDALHSTLGNACVEPLVKVALGAFK